MTDFMHYHRPHALLQTLTAAAVLTLLPPPHPVFASTALEEVVVTARKRQESLQETPIAITAFSADALREGQINNISDLTNNVPGLTRQEGDKRANLSIRGIGTRLSQITADPGVGVYVDSIYMPRNDSQLVDVLNMESVQVLRGPQGTLFGKNTAGGAILLTTRKPSETFEGFASVNLGDRSRQFFRFGVSGPIWQDTLSGGIQLDRRKEDGYRDDAFTGQDYGDVDRKSALGQLRYQSDVLTADLMYFYGKVEEHTSPVNCFFVQRTQLQAFTAPGQSAGYDELCERSESLLDDEKVIMDRSPLVYEITSQLGGATLAWDLNDFTVKASLAICTRMISILHHRILTAQIFTLSTMPMSIDGSWRVMASRRMTRPESFSPRSSSYSAALSMSFWSIPWVFITQTKKLTTIREVT